MALKVNYQSVTNADEAYKKVKTVFSQEYLDKLQVKTDVSYDESAKKVIAKGSGFTLTLCFLEKHCDVDLDLSIVFRPLKAKILEKIEDQIKKNL